MYVKINGCQLYMEVHGQASDAGTIFFIHGGPGLGDCRADIASFASLASRYQLVFVDMRGSGRSEDQPPYSHRQWCADIDGIRQYLGLDKLILHGSSYGGFIAQEYALLYREHVQALLLNVTAPDHEHHIEAIENALESDRTDVGQEELLRLFEGRVKSNADFMYVYGKILPLYATERDEAKEQEKLANIYFHYATHNAAFRDNLLHFDVKEKLRELSLPTLITAGSHDWIIPLAHARKLAEAMPSASFHVFEGLGHSLVREETEAYKALLIDFLDQI